MKRQEIIKHAKCVVIKIGTSTITHADGKLDTVQIKNLASQIAFLKKKGIQIVVVTSGAIGAGLSLLGLKKRPSEISLLQACAAVGQGKLIEAYAQAFKDEGLIAAQILLTAEDLRSRARFLNARNTMLALLKENAVPVVNENDTVAVSEIKFGDNDKLSALVCNLIQADLLIVVSDVEGFYDKLGKVIDRVEKVTREIEDLCVGKGSELGTGGMVTKLEAAKIITRAGGSMIIAGGRGRNILVSILEGEQIGTFFEPHVTGLSAKKQWLAFFTRPHGSIVVDKGAEEALVKKGKSLLSSGVVEIKGSFKIGDIVSIVSLRGNEIARGLVEYKSEEVEKIKKLKSSQIKEVLGSKTSDEIVHRDNMCVL